MSSSFRQTVEGQVRTVLTNPQVSVSMINRLKAAIENGEVDGKTMTHCFFGHLGGGVLGYSSMRVLAGLSRHGALSPVEEFILPVRFGYTPKTSRPLTFLLMWVEEVLAMRRATFTPISVTDEMIDQALFSKAVDALIEETHREAVHSVPELIGA